MNFSDVLSGSLVWRVPGYFPFLRKVAVSALLAVLLLRFASGLAPVFGIGVTAWVFALFYLYFALARAAFVHVHASIYGGGITDASLKRGEFAFGLAFQALRERALRLLSVGLIAGAAIDFGIARVEPQLQFYLIGLFLPGALFLWMWFAPSFLLATGLYTTATTFSPAQARSLLALNGPRIGRSWGTVICMVGVVVFGGGALARLLQPIIFLLPGYFGSLAYSCVLAVLMTAILWIQGRYAAWMMREIVMPRQMGDTEPQPAHTQAPPAKPPFSGPYAFIFAANLLGLSMTILTMAYVIAYPGIPRYEAKVLDSVAMCRIEWTEKVGRAVVHRRCEDVQSYVISEPYTDKRTQRGRLFLMELQHPREGRIETTLFLPDPRAAKAVAESTVSVTYHPELPVPLKLRVARDRSEALFALLLGLLTGVAGLTPILVRMWRRRRQST